MMMTMNPNSLQFPVGYDNGVWDNELHVRVNKKSKTESVEALSPSESFLIDHYDLGTSL